MRFNSVREYLCMILKIRCIELFVALLFMVLVWLSCDVTLNFIMPIVAIIGFNQTPVAPFKTRQLAKLVEELSLPRMLFLGAEPFIVPIGLLIIILVDASFYQVVFGMGFSSFVFMLLLYVVSYCATDVVVCLVKNRQLP